MCAGIADYLGVEPLLVRAGMLVIGGISGIGFALYPLAWALMRATGQRPESWRVRLTGWREAVAITILTGAAVVVLRPLGWLGAAFVWPLIMLSCGLALVLRQVAAGRPGSPRAAMRGRSSGPERGSR